jgi:hypothetical protein
MPASRAGGPEWDRLGKLLEQRRVEMDPRWRDLTLFASERGLDWRMAWDVEHNKRTNYRRVTRVAIEVAYGWEPGSIERVLNGGDPVKDAPAGPEPGAGADFVRSRWPGLVLPARDAQLVREIWATPPEYMTLATKQNLTTVIAEKAAGGSASNPGNAGNGGLRPA